MDDEYNAGYYAGLDGIDFSKYQSLEWQKGWIDGMIIRKENPNIDPAGLRTTGTLIEDMLCHLKNF